MSNRHLRLLLLFTAIAAILIPSAASAGETASQVMKRAAALLQRASGIQASFAMTSGGRTVNGTLRSSSAGFALETPTYSTWYDGKDMWTYNASSRETTLMAPSQAELREANPMLMISGYDKAFSASFARNQGKGTYTVVLTPRQKSTGVKRVVVVIGKGNYRPKQISVTPKSGAAATLRVTSLVTNARLSKSDFTYPKKKYPRAEIIDLR